MSADQYETIDALHAAYRAGETTPVEVVESLLPAVEADEHDAWISTRDPRELRERAREVHASGTVPPVQPDGEGTDPGADVAPLYGVPFAVKDNVDARGFRTTAGCPDYAYEPDDDATVVARLRAAGAILVGKTNMDQFATGLVGTRSPYGVCRNPFDGAYVSGGSSSGSGVAVATGQVAFALGTDTAGSGRVPAAMTNVVGLKPTRGAISAAGVVPACRTLDCVAVFARSIPDALRVERTVAGFDPADPFSRRDADEATYEPALVDSFRVGVPDDDALEFFDAPDAPALFDAAVERLSAIGGTVVTVDYEPFRRTAELLYGGPWVAERLAAIRPFLEASPDSVHPVTRAVIERGDDYSAVDAFEARYELQGLRRAAEDVLADVDLLATPTVAPAYTIEAVEEAPIDRNSDLGYYTNHVNLLDLAALAVPAGFRRSGVPFGITLQAPAFEEPLLGAVGEAFCREHPPRGVLDD